MLRLGSARSVGHGMVARRRPHGPYGAVTPPTPTQLEAVKQALKHGHTPVGMKRPEGGWAAIGLAQASRRVAGKGVEHYYIPGKTPEQRARWEAAVRAYRTSSTC